MPNARQKERQEVEKQKVNFNDMLTQTQTIKIQNARHLEIKWIKSEQTTEAMRTRGTGTAGKQTKVGNIKQNGTHDGRK